MVAQRADVAAGRRRQHVRPLVLVVALLAQQVVVFKRSMNTAGSKALNRRPNSPESASRLTRFLSGLKKINPIKSTASTRTREQLRNQLTIEFLRYRLTHSDAMLQYAGHTVYSEAFRRFLVERYQETAQELSAEQFAETAEISLELLQRWLEQAQDVVRRRSNEIQGRQFA